MKRVCPIVDHGVFVYERGICLFLYPTWFFFGILYIGLELASLVWTSKFGPPSYSIPILKYGKFWADVSNCRCCLHFFSAGYRLPS